MDFINYEEQIKIRDFTLTSADLISVAKDTNSYICNLVKIFEEIEFDIFYSCLLYTSPSPRDTR